MASDAKEAMGAKSKPAEAKARRKIPGNMPYTGSAGVLQRVLEKIPTTEKPSTFTGDFLSTVLGASGGAARPIIPILKSTGLLSQSAVPTELYAEFQTDGGRSAAALSALRKGYSEIFKRNTYAHKAEEKTLTDIVVAITGLPRNEKIVRYIINTFQAFQTYAKMSADTPDKPIHASSSQDAADHVDEEHAALKVPLGLAYNINVILPETTSIDVYNAIFRSLKSNLLR